MQSGSYAISEIEKIVKGICISQIIDTTINHLLIDSRLLVTPENTVFFAINGKHHNGHNYISALYEKGVRNFIISDKETVISNYSACNFILVPNTLMALQALTAAHRKKFSFPIIGITGSNGKTIVKEWLFQLLHEDKKIVRNPKSYNSQVGVPLSVWQLNNDAELGIFEAGISEPDEMDKLQAIIKPTVGIFTNIGQAHDENFIHQTQKIGEKLKLFSKVNELVYCSDYYGISERILKSGISRDIKLIAWSHKPGEDLYISTTIREDGKTKILATYKSKKIEIVIPFLDDASVENAIHCWALMLYWNYDHALIAKRMLQLTPVAMRLELKEGVNHCTIINDSYNSDFNSLAIALDFINQQKQHNKRTVVLSDILQSGRDEDSLYQEIADLLKSKGVTRFIGIGNGLIRQKAKFAFIENVFFSSTDEFLKNYTSSMFNNETVLLKGARLFRFEQIGRIIQQKSHETVFEINLNAIIHNLNFFRSLLKPQTKIMVMVKAFSYGSGSFEITNALQFHHVDYLAVAYVDEGIELRKAGVTIPVMVMNPDEQSFDSMIRYGLEPEIYSFRMFEKFKAVLLRVNKTGNYNVSVHIKLDTGMHRLGFDVKDIPALIKEIKDLEKITVKSVFTHLAAADNPEHDDFTKAQIKSYENSATLISKELNYLVMRHVLNSSGIARFPDYQLDMVRLGIGLYGVDPTETYQKQLENIGTLKTIISQIREVNPPDTVGYSRKGVLNKSMKIATIPIGYADGYSRVLGLGRGKVFINGKMAPIVGNVCMDMCMVDITDIEANEGDDVIIFGNEYPLTSLAKDMETIPYEVITGLSQRIKRIYFQE